MLTFLLSLIHVFKTKTKPKNPTKPPNYHRDLVIEVHILLSTFIILQKVPRTLICVLK